MASTVEDTVGSVGGAGAGEKGLKEGALGLVSSIVVGVASTAPAYSLAASLGYVVLVSSGDGIVGVKAPAIMLLAFLPMYFIAVAYAELNKAEPDCGTTFTWAARAFGPKAGWMGGWGIIVADVIVMANLAQIAGLYTFLLFGVDDPSTLAVTVLGVAFIAGMTYICVIGIELNAKTQIGLLAAELITLTLFAVVALVLACVGGAGEMLVPVLLYGACLGAMAVLSTGVNRFTAVGGALFLVSDGLIALDVFVPAFGLPAQGFWVMSTYVAAQALLVGGVLLERERTQLAPMQTDAVRSR